MQNLEIIQHGHTTVIWICFFCPLLSYVLLGQFAVINASGCKPNMTVGVGLRTIKPMKYLKDNEEFKRMAFQIRIGDTADGFHDIQLTPENKFNDHWFPNIPPRVMVKAKFVLYNENDEAKIFTDVETEENIRTTDYCVYTKHHFYYTSKVHANCYGNFKIVSASRTSKGSSSVCDEQIQYELCFELTRKSCPTTSTKIASTRRTTKASLPLVLSSEGTELLPAFVSTVQKTSRRPSPEPERHLSPDLGTTNTTPVHTVQKKTEPVAAQSAIWLVVVFLVLGVAVVAIVVWFFMRRKRKLGSQKDDLKPVVTDTKVAAEETLAVGNKKKATTNQQNDVKTTEMKTGITVEKSIQAATSKSYSCEEDMGEEKSSCKDVGAQHDPKIRQSV